MKNKDDLQLIIKNISFEVKDPTMDQVWYVENWWMDWVDFTTKQSTRCNINIDDKHWFADSHDVLVQAYS